MLFDKMSIPGKYIALDLWLKFLWISNPNPDKINDT